VAAELATTPFDSTMARTVSSTDEHHGRLRRNPLPMGPGERVPLVALHRKGNLCRHGVILAMYGKSIRGLTLEGADSHGTQSRGSRPPQPTVEGRACSKPPPATTDRCRVGSHPAPAAGNAFAKQVGQQDHLDDVDRTDN
jgi:hypothetical protein